MLIAVLFSALTISAGSLYGQSPSKGFYVAPDGNDNNPGTLERPFATLGKAQLAMRASSSIKTTYIRAGHYTPPLSAEKAHCMNGNPSGTSVNLTNVDAGETWSYYPPDGYNSAILDGQSTAGQSGRKEGNGNGTGCAFSGYKLSNITITGLQFQNYLYSAFWVNTGTGLVFSDNIVHNLTAAAWGAGAISTTCAPGTIVKNNYIYDVAYTGTELETRADCPGGISGDVVSGNIIENSCTWPAEPHGNDQNGGDCGAIYFDDRISPASTDIQVTNNYVRDVNVSSKGAANNGKDGKGGCCAIGVYLDDGTSNVAITGNIIGGIASSCFHLHGGDNNSIKNNICDLANSEYQSIAVYQQSKQNHEMSGNIFTNNIILSGSKHGGSGFMGYNAPPNPLAISNNVYFSCSGSKPKSVGTGGAGGDSSPVFENPRVSGWTYDIADGSSANKDSISFQKIEGGWGPPNLKFPERGTPPSCSR